MDLSREKEIIKEAQRDPEAFGLLYDEYYQPIFRYILRRTANLELAEDLTSQTFFKALKKMGRFRWQNLPFSAWLYRIATNEINDFYRREKRFIRVNLDRIPELSSEDEADKEFKIAEEELKNKEDFLKVHQSISKLQPIYQTVISLRFFEKKKISEISQILGKPEGTVKSQIHRAIEELRGLMVI